MAGVNFVVFSRGERGGLLRRPGRRNKCMVVRSTGRLRGCHFLLVLGPSGATAPRRRGGGRPCHLSSFIPGSRRKEHTSAARCSLIHFIVKAREEGCVRWRRVSSKKNIYKFVQSSTWPWGCSSAVECALRMSVSWVREVQGSMSRRSPLLLHHVFVRAMGGAGGQRKEAGCSKTWSANS